MKTLMNALTSEEQFYEIIKESQVNVFVFSANWCPDCTFIQPFMAELIQKYKNYKFIYVDRDQFIDLCIDQEILGIPSFVAYQDGKELSRFVSKLRKTKEEIDAFLGEL